MVTFVFAAQLGIILWLSERTPPRIRPPAKAPVLHLASHPSTELLALTDPTLFALPHREGFSGPAWVVTSNQPFSSPEWSEPPQWLPLAVQELGEPFRQFIRTNRFDEIKALPELDAELMLPKVPPLAFGSTSSTLVVAGGLSGRTLLTKLELPSWPSADILTNSVVQVLVDDNSGQPISASLLLPGSGLKSADQHALSQAMQARFESLNDGGPLKATNRLSQLTWGDLIFVWHSLPATNTTETK
jgi:hypothetical protein